MGNALGGQTALQLRHLSGAPFFSLDQLALQPVLLAGVLSQLVLEAHNLCRNGFKLVLAPMAQGHQLRLQGLDPLLSRRLTGLSL